MHYEIDLQNEQVITLTDVSSYLPKRRGKKTHYQTVFRWATKGVRGNMLASVKIGGIRYTSLEALRRFCKSYDPDIQVNEYQDAVEAALGKGRW